MRNEPDLAESATLVSPGWVEKRLNISRTTRLALEERGALEAVRLTKRSHRRYRLADVEALAKGRP